MSTVREPKIYPHLIEFKQKGVIALTGKFMEHWEDKGTKVIMLGYTANKSSNTYQVFNPKTRKILEQQDVV